MLQGDGVLIAEAVDDAKTSNTGFYSVWDGVWRLVGCKLRALNQVMSKVKLPF